MKKKVLIVVSDYYENISKGLLKSTKTYLNKKTNLNIIKVPGVFEIPVIISKNILKKYFSKKKKMKFIMVSGIFSERHSDAIQIINF